MWPTRRPRELATNCPEGQTRFVMQTKRVLVVLETDYEEQAMSEQIPIPSPPEDLEARTAALVELDAANADRYRSNRDRLVSRIDSLTAELEFALAVPQRSYIAHHDAYQYFEKAFALEAAGFIKDSHDAEPSFSNLSKLGHMVELQTANCIVYSAAERPRIIDSLGSTVKTRYSRVPIMGLEYKAGPDQWFDLMKTVNRRFRQCLQ